MSVSVILCASVGVIAFILGVRFERARVAYANWRDAVAAIPGLRSLAFMQAGRVWVPALLLIAIAAGLLYAAA